jgi:molybdate transport system regulatory protein
MATGRDTRTRRAAKRGRVIGKTRSAAAIKLWIRLTLPASGPIGPGKIDLLRKIRETRSISAAAREMGMSYRRAWLLVDELNGAFRRPVVVKWLGGSSHGGAMLTPTGAKLVDSYDAVIASADAASRNVLDDLASLVRRQPA